MLDVIRLQLTFVVGKVFWVGLCWMSMAPCSSLTLLVFGIEVKGLLRSILVGGVWNGFLLGRVKGQPVPCRFCVSPDGDGHLLGECTFPPLVEIRENQEVHDLMREDKAHWPSCLLWHGWLPMLSGVNGVSPWAADASESAFYLVETALGHYSSGLVSEWTPPDDFDVIEVSTRMPGAPMVWSDGSLILDSTTSVSAAGSGYVAHHFNLCWSGRRWGHVDRVLSNDVAHSCRVFCLSLDLCRLFTGLSCGRSLLLFSLLMLSTLELTILVLFGMLDVCLIVALLLLLLNLLLLVIFLSLFAGCLIFVVVTRFVLLRSRVTLMRIWFLMVGFVSLIGFVTMLLIRKLTLVVGGLVLLLLMPVVICLGFVVVGIQFFLIFLELLLIMMGLVGLLLIRWSGLLVLCPRGGGLFMLFVTLLCFLVLRLSGLVSGLLVLGADEIAQWPYTPGLLVKWVSLLGGLHWIVGRMDLGVGGVSYVELLILYELWAGERLSGISYVELLILCELWAGESLVLVKAHPWYLRPGRPISVSVVPFGPGIDIWLSCRFIGAVMRSLCLLPGGLRRFVPCSIGANHCRLRHIGWEKCGHGLTSRPRESASEPFLNELLCLFRYPPGSGRALLAGCLVVLVGSCLALLVLIIAGFGMLVGRGVVMGSLLVLRRVPLPPCWTSFCCFFTLAGTLPLRYCSAKFASKTPFWALPVPGHVARLISVEVQVAQVGEAEVVRHGVHFAGISGSGRRRCRLNRKTPAHLVGHSMHARPRVWKRLHFSGFTGISGVDCKKRRCNQQDDGGSPVHPRTGVG